MDDGEAPLRGYHGRRPPARITVADRDAMAEVHAAAVVCSAPTPRLARGPVGGGDRTTRDRTDVPPSRRSPNSPIDTHTRGLLRTRTRSPSRRETDIRFVRRLQSSAPAGQTRSRVVPSGRRRGITGGTNERNAIAKYLDTDFYDHRRGVAAGRVVVGGYGVTFQAVVLASVAASANT
jgi:hypothetical protein